jgi:hypothetical protein
MKIRKFGRIAIDTDRDGDEYSSSLYERTHWLSGYFPMLSFIRFRM